MLSTHSAQRCAEHFVHLSLNPHRTQDVGPVVRPALQMRKLRLKVTRFIQSHRADECQSLESGMEVRSPDHQLSSYKLDAFG